MTQEEKELLLKDLCARLPYGVFIHTWYDNPLDIKCTGIDLYTNTINLDIPDDDDAKVYIDNCKPYLRPMLSMTEEEKEIYKRFCDEDIRQLTYVQEIHPGLKQKTSCHRSIDWLNKKSFDYRGLIPMGLALEAHEDMYKTE